MPGLSGETGDHVRGFPIELRGVRCATDRSGAAKVPGVNGDSVCRFPTELRDAPPLEARIDFACAVESWASDMKVLNRFCTYKYFEHGIQY